MHSIQSTSRQQTIMSVLWTPKICKTKALFGCFVVALGHDFMYFLCPGSFFCGSGRIPGRRWNLYCSPLCQPKLWTSLLHWRVSSLALRASRAHEVAMSLMLSIPGSPKRPKKVVCHKAFIIHILQPWVCSPEFLTCTKSRRKSCFCIRDHQGVSLAWFRASSVAKAVCEKGTQARLRRLWRLLCIWPIPRRPRTKQQQGRIAP